MRPEHWIYTIPLRLRSFFRRSQVDEELDEELRDHLERATGEYLAKGMALEEAQRRARLALGGVEKVKEECRDARRVSWIQDLMRDLHFGLRMLRKSPGFTTVAILTLALGIGANTAIFSVVNAVLLRPLPYKDADDLVLVKEVLPKMDSQPVGISGPDISLIRKFNHSFAYVAGFRVWTYELSGNTEPERTAANRVSADLFKTLGVQPILGRAFTPAEEEPGHPVVILGYGLWQDRFGGNPNILGQTLYLDRQPYTVVGVMPQSFVFPLPGMSQGNPVELFVPLALTKAEQEDFGDNFSFGVVARLKPGFQLAQANADLQLAAQSILRVYEQWASAAHFSLGDFQLGVVSDPLAESVRGPVRPALLLLLGAVAFVLLIACVNVGSLLLARAATRQREMAVRLAMGAGRGRLLRQLLVEGTLLALGGGGLGLLVAVWIKGGLAAAMPTNIPRFHAMELDGAVLLFTFILVAVTALIFGSLPAFSSARTNLNHSLKDSGRSPSLGRDHQRLRATLVVVEISLSAMLLVGAGLLLHSFQRVLDTNPGFRPEHVLTASIDLPTMEYNSAEQVVAFYKQLIDRLRQMPGRVASGASSDLPLQGGWTHVFTLENGQPPNGAGFNTSFHSVIYGDYLQAMGIPLLRGRYFTEQDTSKSTRVLIVSESLAKRYWPGQDPLGKRLKWGPPESSDPWLTVVGVVGDVKQGPLDSPTVPHTYEPFVQLGGDVAWLRVAMRSEGDPASLVASLRSIVHSIDSQLALDSVNTMTEVISRSTADRRFNLLLLGSFAALALMLAAMGIYGVLTYSVTQRTHEIGVRMALGASGSEIVRLVLNYGFRLTLIGSILGIAGALALTRVVQRFLYEVRPTDPLTFFGVFLLLGGVALTASYVPARRATRVDPMVALRYE